MADTPTPRARKPKTVPTTTAMYVEEVVPADQPLRVQSQGPHKVQVLSAGPYGAEVLYKYLVITTGEASA